MHEHLMSGVEWIGFERKHSQVFGESTINDILVAHVFMDNWITYTHTAIRHLL